MITCPPNRLEKAVVEICPDISMRACSNASPRDERMLWHELSCCLLSSQVPYSLAVAAADAIDRNGMLTDRQSYSTTLSSELCKLLSEPLTVEGKQRRYRFPRSRADQLAAVRVSISHNFKTLEEFLRHYQLAEDARCWLVKNAQGIGPKQASMFLRNAGFSYDLAVLDRHVLNYMAALRLLPSHSVSTANLASYSRKEDILRSYAIQLGVKVGILDWAIWIVMRQAQKFLEENLA